LFAVFYIVLICNYVIVDVSQIIIQIIQSRQSGSEARRLAGEYRKVICN
jgi:hypothetical protein